jgi:hypothetical protein
MRRISLESCVVIKFKICFIAFGFQRVSCRSLPTSKSFYDVQDKPGLRTVWVPTRYRLVCKIYLAELEREVSSMFNTACGFSACRLCTLVATFRAYYVYFSDSSVDCYCLLEVTGPLLPVSAY